MNASISPVLAARTDLRPRPLIGLGNVLRKDLREWTHARRFWIVLVLSTIVYVLAAANARIIEWVIANVPATPGDPVPRVPSLVPMDNLLMPLGTQFYILAAIFATISLVIGERENGTLAWTVSKPVSRTSVLVSKWLSATLLLWIAAIVVPLAVTTAVVAALYGVPDIGAVALLGAGLIGITTLFVAISIAAATFIPSQAGVAAVGLGVFFLPPMIGGLVPAAAPLLPTSIQEWAFGAALGGPTPIVTPVAWLVGLGLLFVLARAGFRRAEL